MYRNPALKKTAAAVESLHGEIDLAVKKISNLHESRLQCRRGCRECCMDDISVFEIEADLIRFNHEQLLSSKNPGPAGACAFLDINGSCRIYEHRPYVCRTQGLPLHWLEEHNGNNIGMRDICPLNDNGTPVENLPEDACWIIGPFEEKLAELQYNTYENSMRRVKLRDLFAQ
jgi:Fe-S-cluster containining protein